MVLSPFGQKIPFTEKTTCVFIKPNLEFAYNPIAIHKYMISKMIGYDVDCAV